jgi:4-amino-4-deoxy-L-arabinose transferase-like glycosyltransferase
MNRNNAFWILTISIFIGLLLPTLVQDGMFLDGVTYSAISKNMANGIGGFWNPHYTNTLYPSFHEHPPLIFIIQSFFFRVLGDGIYTERIYCLLTAILTATGIVLCWRLYNKKNDLEKYSWLLIVLWITIPLIFWSYKNNLLEDSMCVFTVFSVYFISKSLIENKIIYLVPGSVLIVMAFLSKGAVGLFPIVVPVIFSLVFRIKKHGKSIFYNVCLIVLTVSLFYLLSILIPELKKNIFAYFEQQVLPALANQREMTTNNRLSILIDLITELIFPLAILLFITISRWIKARDLNFPQNKESLFFLLVAISASLPLIISLKQRKFYLVPSIPFYILSIAFLVVPYLKVTIENITIPVLTWLKKISYFALSFVILFSAFCYGKYSRDEEKLKDIYAVSMAIPDGTIIGTTKDLCKDWSLVAYMSRIGNLSLDCDSARDYYLINKKNIAEIRFLEKYDKLDLNLKKYTIYKRRRTESNNDSKTKQRQQ